MSDTERVMRINVDPRNPGQYFACVGLLELAERLSGEAAGWFERDSFNIAADLQLDEMISAVSHLELEQLVPENKTASPIQVLVSSRPLRLDWWLDEWAGGKELKVWAGTMESFRIASAMQNAIREKQFRTGNLFNEGMVVYHPQAPGKKVEPFYFDARRCPNAHSRDVGFAPNDLQMTTVAYPAVEFLCLIGLQRGMPAKTAKRRIFDYFTWTAPIVPSLIPAAVSGLMPLGGQVRYRFENWYRTGQKKHKAFRSAIPFQHEVTYE